MPGRVRRRCARRLALKVLEFLWFFDINPRINFRLSRPPQGPGLSRGPAMESA